MLKEFISEREAKKLQQEFSENMKSYQNREEGMEDQTWLRELIRKRCPDIHEEEAEKEAKEILDTLERNSANLMSVNEACNQGISKEQWMANKLQNSAIGMSAEQYSMALKKTEAILHQQNMELAEALSRAEDGHIMMSPNLDGNIAEHMIARTTELQGYIQNKNIKVEVRGVNTANSVDVRATNLDTGKYQNYQLKFGKDAKATIELIERGNYDNQRIIVPSDQLKEIQTYFTAKGSKKSISDHIEINGVKGAAFTKAEMKNLQKKAQESGAAPVLDDYYYTTKEYALSIGREAGVMALQTAAITTGIDVMAKICQGQEIKADEVVETALKTGTDVGVKVVASGTLHTAVRRGVIPFLPKTMKANTITNIAFVGVENTKILLKMAEGKISTMKGLDHMGRTTVSMVGGLTGVMVAGGAVAGLALGGPLAIGAGLVAGMVGYSAGSTIGDKIYSCAKKVGSFAKKTVEKVIGIGSKVVSGAKKIIGNALSFFG